MSLLRVAVCLGMIFALNARAGGIVLPIPVSVASTGYVSVALLDTNGVQVRTLAAAEPVTPGVHTFFWDATTDLGLAAPPGSYTTRGIFFSNPPALHFVMKVGTSGNPPWRLRDGTGDWGGDLGGPSAIVANSTSLMVLWSTVENYTLPGIQQIDTNGNVMQSWTSFYPYDGRMAAVMDDREFFLAILNRSLERMEIAAYDLETGDQGILAVLPTPPHYALSGRFQNSWDTVADGMAMTTNRIFVSVAVDNTLFVLDRATGDILQQAPLPSPRGLAVVSDGLLVVTSNGVLKTTFDGAVVGTLCSGTPLNDPYAIAIDRSTNIYVSDGGSHRLDPDAVTGNHQVHVFDSTGAYLRSMGLPGGSPRSGTIVRQGFGDVRGLCIGPDGKLWANEEITGFKRTSRWNTNGVLEREWFQRKLTHYADLVNPAATNELVYARSAFDDYPALTGCTVDWATGTWEPAWSYAQTEAAMYQEDVFISHDHPQPLQEYQPDRRYPTFHYNPAELVTFNGRTYFLNHEGNGDGAVFIWSATNAPRPVALVGYHRVDIITNRIVSYYDTGPNRWFTWADTNGDGRMAMNECLIRSPTRLANSVRMYDATLLTNLSIRLLRPVGNGRCLESILPLKALLSNGVPVYDWSMLQDLPAHQMPDFAGGDGWKTVTHVDYETIPVEDGGAVYALVDPVPGVDLNLPSIDHFWADRNWRKRVAKFDRATGQFLWASGHRAPGRAMNGDMYNAFGLTVSHGAIFAADVLGMVWLWSTDGLYLGRLLNDAEPGRTWDEYAVHVEVQGPVTLFTNATTGKLYMIINDTGAHVYEVTLPAVQPLSPVAVELTAGVGAAVRRWDPDNHAPPAGSLLDVTTTSNAFVLSWHTNAAAMTLQQASAVTGLWSTVIAPRATNGQAISVSLPPTAARRFYRLDQP